MASSERESVKVIVRCRPFSEKEKAAGHTNIVTIDKAAATVSIVDPRSSGGANDPPKTFTFDSVFDITSTQQEVYNKTARPIIESVLAGYNGTIFAYGQTGTGKASAKKKFNPADPTMRAPQTFSMEGVRDVPELRGIIPNSFEHIFAEIALSGSATQFLVRASYLELYNEEIRDLLNPKAGKLEIKERADIGIYVKDLRTFVIKDVEEMDRLMSFGNKNRSVGATEMNARSSRSHSIFSITVEAADQGGDGQEHIRAGKLHLVDLAGSERQSKTGAAGERLKEATKINLSLSALGNVISALVDGKSSHIPYRDSKLTRLLQDSLGGNAKTLMVATLSPASYNYDETVSTLRYASRAKNIKNKPKINEDPKDAMLREFQEEIKRLKAQLESIDNGTAPLEPIIQEIEEIEEVEEVEEVEEEEEATPGAQPQTETEAKPKKTKMKKVKTLKSHPPPGPQPATHAPPSAADQHSTADHEAELKAMQESVEREKQAILASKDMEETERNRLVAALEARAAELEAEREARAAVATKLAQLEQKLLVGGVNMIDKNEEQQLLLAKQAQEIEERARQERELARELEEHEEVNLQIEEEFSSLQEEAAAKTRKLKKLWNLLMRHKAEIKDLQEEHQREREDLLETIRGLTRELKLRSLVCDSFVPAEEMAVLEACADYEEASEKWRIAHIAHAGNNIRGKRSLVTGMVLGPSLHRDHQFGSASGSSEDLQNWDPGCVFPDVYLSYDVPTLPAKKRTSGGSGGDRGNKAQLGDRAPSRKGRPASAARRSPTKGLGGPRDRVVSGSRSGGNSSAASNSSLSAPEEQAAPTARGLVGKTKHYA
ncbi:Kinesin-like protein kif3a [Borealophlyctis nickersoniae]|nr:Kinesin-like protein kif3a [Borealophlyctis nickersoniae]